MTNQITLIDAGTGNLRSVLKALESIGLTVTLTSEANVIRQSTKLVLPGVGAFGDFMKGLRINHLDEAVLESVHRGIPILGICVGMQALFQVGEELGEHPGLSLLQGRVIRFEPHVDLKIPHTGWNQLWIEKKSPLWTGLSSGEHAYFNHSYYCLPANPEDIISATDYGIYFTSAVQRENVFGVQFHPEKSQRVGIQVLVNFLKI